MKRHLFYRGRSFDATFDIESRVFLVRCWDGSLTFTLTQAQMANKIASGEMVEL